MWDDGFWGPAAGCWVIDFSCGTQTFGYRTVNSKEYVVLNKNPGCRAGRDTGCL